MDWINEYFKVFQFALTSIFTIIVFVLLLVFVKRKEHEVLKAKVQKIEDTYSTDKAHTALAQQVNTLEAQLKDLPNSKDFNRIEKEVSELKGSVDGMAKLLTNINNHVNMLVENEIKGN